MPAQAQCPVVRDWVPACAGMTNLRFRHQLFLHRILRDDQKLLAEELPCERYFEIQLQED